MRRKFAIVIASVLVAGVFGVMPDAAYSVSLSEELSSQAGIEYRSQETGVAKDRAMTEEVWDTYLVLNGLLNGQPVQGKIIKVFYKRITFNKTYTQLPSTLVSVDAIPENERYMEGIGMVFGSIETWRCNYSIS